MSLIPLFTLVTLSLIAFAGNSILCRLALTQTSISPGAFVITRLLSGALVLWLILSLKKPAQKLEGSWSGALALFIYALTFAWAYSDIPAGTGALLLFASIQISMILYGLLIGERLSLWQSTGLSFAILGLIILMLPKIGAPPPLYALLMILSGIAWGSYTLLGRRTKDPIAATAGNFIRATPIALLFCLPSLNLSLETLTSPDLAGLGYGVLSGAIASGLGYVLWYAVVKHLKVTHAATVQLAVPVITAFGGALFLNEAITTPLILSTLFIILGISLVIFTRRAK